MATSMITHMVVVPDDTRERRTTFFQGFSDFWFPEYAQILHALTFFPHDLIDPLLPSEQYVLARLLGGGSNIQFLRADLLSGYLRISTESNLVLWSSELTARQVSEAMEGVADKPVHISIAKIDDAICIYDLDKKTIDDLASTMLSKAAKHNDEIRQAKELLERLRSGPRSNPVFEARGHNCTEPMMRVLASCGYQIKMTPVKPSDSIEEHVLGMAELAHEIDELRPKQWRESPLRNNDSLVYCPSSYTYLYRADGALWNKLNRKLDNVKRNFLKNAIVRNRGYGNIGMQSGGEIFNPYADKVLGPLLHEKQSELKLFTTVIGLASAIQCIPALRLPNSVMLHHAKLRAIGQLINSNNKKRRQKLNLQFEEYSRSVKDDAGIELMQVSFANKSKVLCVCDLPVEWVAIDNLPIMYSHEISRVPSTPGNVAISTLLSRTKKVYPYAALCDILILRSFTGGDPIRDHLTSAVNYMVEQGKLEGLRVSIVDINSREELVGALNKFKGLMVIFDCHGNHGGEEDIAWLEVGGERLDIWHIYQEARVPPIVVLAACSTHPVEGSHASVANGFLESGAESVIGTFAPVDSAHATVFVVRLLERVATYLPLVLARRNYNWREVVTGLLRMSYVRDVLDLLKNEMRLLSEEEYYRIHVDANMSINMNEDGGWFEEFKSSICEALGYDQEQGSLLWKNNFQFLDSMLFVQLGRPENIIITSSDF
ncbi:CHAT domain-containing protein [Pseudomonas sp. B21-035]|uniref:CHAT domain-containing protein n=1 Tax=Pseudomonas sp. B21-035 TaxID=2895484 RepID=UPI00216036D1|nr:CHAT domain-containing protein [Pseudomonas sp. B21-035]UVL56242.1 CHAT domain-containing protein [Pseudomonas sp. B21-035]